MPIVHMFPEISLHSLKDGSLDSDYELILNVS